MHPFAEVTVFIVSTYIEANDRACILRLRGKESPNVVVIDTGLLLTTTIDLQ
jgi:hypothetical protein